MTFEEANKAIEERDPRKFSEAWDAFGFSFTESICADCTRYSKCHARKYDDDEGCMIDYCNFFKEQKYE